MAMCTFYAHSGRKRELRQCQGLSRSDGKRPDGVSIVPWKNDRVLVWDVTCPDTYASSYIAKVTSKAGAVANFAEGLKRTNMFR